MIADMDLQNFLAYVPEISRDNFHGKKPIIRRSICADDIEGQTERCSWLAECRRSARSNCSFGRPLSHIHAHCLLGDVRFVMSGGLPAFFVFDEMSEGLTALFTVTLIPDRMNSFFTITTRTANMTHSIYKAGLANKEGVLYSKTQLYYRRASAHYRR